MWKLPTLESKSSSVSTETDVVVVFQDAAKKAIVGKGPYSAVAARIRKGDSFEARCGSVQYVRFGGKRLAENVLFVGLGAEADLTEEKIRVAGANAWAKLQAEKSKTAVVHLDSALGNKMVRAFAEGMILATYQFNKHKSAPAAKDKKFTGTTKLTFITKDNQLKKQLDSEFAQLRAVGEAVTVTRDWSNEPSNIGTPEYFAAESQKLAKQYGLKCTVLTEKDAEKEKMGLFIGVGAGSEREGRIVVLEYIPSTFAKNPTKTLALVGKGVTFDSGGISIKPSMRMEDMKHDMTGAATIMGAILLASKWKVPNRVVAILAFTENMPDGMAIQPGNVLMSRAGKTVEIINTDAEGRLILADVLDYAHGFKPDAIVDAATLTGAVSVALGKHCCGILGNNEDLIDQIRKSGEAHSERVWQLPLYDDYFEDMKSDTADMKNSVNDGNGGTIRGAIFLKQFIKKDVPWAHLDIAATAWNMGHLSYYPKRGASGAYVRTLAQFAADF